MDEMNTGLLSFSLPVILHNFLNTAKRLILIVVLLALAVGGAVYYRTDRAYTPIYASSAVFSVHASYSSTTDILSYSSFLDKNTALMLSSTFPYVIRSENTMMLLRQELGTSIINGSVNATSTADSALFTLTATSSSPQDAYDILRATIRVYPTAAGSILGDTQIDIINMPGGPPTEPMNPNNALRMGLTFAFPTFLVGVVAIFLLSLTRKTVHSSEDLRRLVNLKCLAYIPCVKLKKHSNKSNLNIIITNPRISSDFNESVRNLRIKLQKALEPQKSQVLLVTSTLPNEGKTTVATNLALSLASEGKRVILIDGDLRKQSLKASLGISEPSEGLVEVLSGSSKNFRLLNVPKSTLLLLSGDETSERPQPLLDTPRMAQVLEVLREKLDYIIIDTPPAGILSDAATIAKYADAMLYVVRQDLASTTQILNSIQALSVGSVNLIGCVLNRTQAGTTRYGYGSKYSNGYGYKYTAGYGYKRYGRYAEAEQAAKDLTREISESAEDK